MSAISKDKLVFDVTALNDSDSVGSYLRDSSGNLLTSTLVGAAQALDVNIANTSLAVTATNLDIRDLAFATDKVDASGSTVELGSTTLAALESITVQNGAGASAVNIQDGGNSITVDATLLDIRHLTFANDKVDASGSTVKLQDGSGNAITSAAGSLNVAVTSGTINATLNPSYAFLTGTTHVPATDDGAFILALNPSGQYAGMNVDASGNLKVTGTFTSAVPNTSSAYSAINVSATATALPTSPLASRKKLMIQNLANKAVYIGTNNSVTASNGMRVAAGANVELEWGPAITVYAIGTQATNDIRVLEIA